MRVRSRAADPHRASASSHSQEHGAQRLRDALLHHGEPSALNSGLVPLLRVLGSDALAGGTCRQALLQLLEAVFRIPGLLPNLQQAVDRGLLADASPVAWFLRTLALQVGSSPAAPLANARGVRSR